MCTSLLLSKLGYGPIGFVKLPVLLIRDNILLYLRSPKDDCYSISGLETSAMQTLLNVLLFFSIFKKVESIFECNVVLNNWNYAIIIFCCRRMNNNELLRLHLNGVEVAGLTVDRKIGFDSRQTLITYGLWWQGDERRLRASSCLCRGGLGTLKTPSCPWRWVTGSRSKF